MNNESNSPNHTGSFFLLKINQYGIQEQLIELDTTIYDYYSKVGQINNGSYWIYGWGGPGLGNLEEGNLLRIDSDFSNQTTNYEVCFGKFNSDGYTSLQSESSIIWDPFTLVTHYKLSNVLWTGDTLWASDDILSEIVAVDSNFSINNGWNSYLGVKTITDDGGCILMGQNVRSLHLAKISFEGVVEWVKIIENGSYEDAYNYGTPISLFYYIEQTIDGGFIVSGRNLMKLSSQGEFEWINENPIEMDDIINTDFDVRQMNYGGYLLAGYYPNNDLENGVPFIIKADNSGNVLSRVDFTDLLPPTRFEATDDGGYIFSAIYDLGNGETDVAIIKFNSDGHMLELEN